MPLANHGIIRGISYLPKVPAYAYQCHILFFIPFFYVFSPCLSIIRMYSS